MDEKHLSARQLETTRFVLEPLQAAHADEMFPIVSDPRLYAYTPGEAPLDCAALRRRYIFLEQGRSPNGTELWLNWIIRCKNRKICLGRVEATLRSDASALLAYEVMPERWREGIATEACSAAIIELFQHFGAQSICAQVDTRNRASIQLLLRLGFSQGALQKDADFFKGSSSDEFTFWKLKTLPM